MTHDVIVIGGGPGGYVAAIRAAQLGGKVALIESSHLGGTCLNRGCIPSKAFIHMVGEGGPGPSTAGSADALYQTFAKKSRGSVDKLRASLAQLVQANAVEIFSGWGSLTGKDGCVEVKDSAGGVKSLQGRAVILATGSAPHQLALFPLDEKTVVSSDGVLAMDKLPATMLVVGGGAIGTEWAYVLNGLGVKVKIVEAESQLLPAEDAAAAKILENGLRKQGIAITLGTKLEEAEKAAGGWRVRIQGAWENFDKVLVAVGRRPAVDGIGIEKLGVVRKHAFVQVDARMRTNVPWLYAIGDMTGISMLAHAAIAQGRCAASNAMGQASEFDAAFIPRCVYTLPEVASVGVTEAGAKAAGKSVRSGKFPYAALGKAHCIEEEEGFFKVVAEEGSRRILGVQIVGYGATDLIAEACVLLRMKATLDDVIATVHPHPTLSEGIWEAACAADGQGVHVFSRKRGPAA